RVLPLRKAAPSGLTPLAPPLREKEPRTDPGFGPATPGRCSPSTSIFAELALSVADDGDTGPSRLAREPGSQTRRSTTRRKARRRRRTRQCRSRTLQSVARDPVCAISALPVLRDDAIEEHGRTPGVIEDTDRRSCCCCPRPRG